MGLRIERRGNGFEVRHTDGPGGGWRKVQARDAVEINATVNHYFYGEHGSTARPEVCPLCRLVVKKTRAAKGDA